jgi:hypothetical protein
MRQGKTFAKKIAHLKSAVKNVLLAIEIENLPDQQSEAYC